MKALEKIQELEKELKKAPWFMEFSKGEEGFNVVIALIVFSVVGSILGYGLGKVFGLDNSIFYGILSVNLLGFSLPTFVANIILKSRLKSVKETPLGKIAAQYLSVIDKINHLKTHIEVYQNEITAVQNMMKPTLPTSELTKGQTHIEVRKQEIKNLEIKIACLEELAQNWQRKYDTEVFQQTIKRLNTDNNNKPNQNLQEINELENKAGNLQVEQMVEQIQQELNLTSDEQHDKLVSIELNKEQQQRLETLLETLKKINESEK